MLVQESSQSGKSETSAGSSIRSSSGFRVFLHTPLRKCAEGISVVTNSGHRVEVLQAMSRFATEIAAACMAFLEDVCNIRGQDPLW